MFDVSKSKLYSQIMEAAVSFFGLDKDSATEAEVHDALETAEPLEQQLTNARESASADAVKVEALETKVNDFQKQLDDLKGQIATKDSRIAELQTESQAATASHDKALEALKAQHSKEISTLAGQVSALKAGKIQEQDEGGGETTPAAKKTSGGVEVLAVQDESLKAWVKKRQN